MSSIRRFVRTEWRDRIAKAAITAIFRPGTGPQSRKSVLPIPLAYILIFFGNEWVEKTNTASPAINIIESDNDYKVEVAAPGMTKDDFSIKIDPENQLIVSMEKKTENDEKDKKGKYLRREFSYSRFQQIMVLPENVEKDKIDAKVENGVLTIDIPKKVVEPEEKRMKEIAIK